jgi:hypothetical protein
VTNLNTRMQFRDLSHLDDKRQQRTFDTLNRESGFTSTSREGGYLTMGLDPQEGPSLCKYVNIFEPQANQHSVYYTLDVPNSINLQAQKE